jgi:hypothetical protein
VACLVLIVSGYQIPGGYEHIMFYLAYRLEYLTNDGKATSFATTCVKEKGTKANPCSFDQFLDYIADKTDRNTPKDFTATGKDFKDIPKVDASFAQKLLDKGLTGAVVPGRVLQGVGNSYDELFRKTGSYLASVSTHPKVLDDLKQECRDAIKAVLTARMSATTGDFEIKQKAITRIGEP